MSGQKGGPGRGVSRPEWDVWLESLQQVTHPMPALRTIAM
jgi:hypothetical protein